MEKLTKRLVEDKAAHLNGYEKDSLPEKVIQFGEGNFLRGFVDWMIHELNKQGMFNGTIVAIQPTPHGKVVPKLNRQDGLYTLAIRGIENNQVIETNDIISSISRGINPYTDWEQVLEVAESREIKFMFSNTTEAGLTYEKEEYDGRTAPLSFPGKVTAFLHHRYTCFQGSEESGLYIIPCELVDKNGELLKELVERISRDWNLPEEFIQWVRDNNHFCNTLVDRIVTGYPTNNIAEYRQLLGYEDELLTTGEPYHLFAIDGDEDLPNQLPFQKAGINVKWGDIAPFQELKVRLLNGTHTMMFAASYLAGADTVLEAMEDELLSTFISKGLYEEIVPVVRSNEQEKQQFVDSVMERFKNPFNRHLLNDIGMNAVSKFRSRLIPTLLEYVNDKEELPPIITFSLAALIAYYSPSRVDGQFLIGKRGEAEYTIRESEETIQLFNTAWENYGKTLDQVKQLVRHVLSEKHVWGVDLTTVSSLCEEVATDLERILKEGMRESIRSKLKK